MPTWRDRRVTLLRELTRAAGAAYVDAQEPFRMFLYMGRDEALLLRESRSAAMSALATQPAAEEAFE